MSLCSRNRDEENSLRRSSAVYCRMSANILNLMTEDEDEAVLSCIQTHVLIRLRFLVWITLNGTQSNTFKIHDGAHVLSLLEKSVSVTKLRKHCLQAYVQAEDEDIRRVRRPRPQRFSCTFQEKRFVIKDS